MSDSTVGYSPALADGVAAYVRDVRAELADLSVEDVDDLTGGMEADLSELAAESGGDLIGRLGSPSRYAAELRSAAGLPERLPGSGRRRRPLSEALADTRASFTRLTERHPWLRSVAAFLVTLRPAWWLLRGYLAAWALWSMLGGGGSRGVRPHSFFEVVIALAAIVVSVQLGRGWLRQRTLWRPVLALFNATLVVVALIASISVDRGYDAGAVGYSAPPGLSVDGRPVGNIYPYDSAGKRITGVRLFAQDGLPLNGDQSTFDAAGNQMGVVRDTSGAPLWNVYPRALVGLDPWQVTDPANPEANPGQWTPPVSIVPLTSSTAATPTAPTSLPTGTTGSPPPTSKPPTPSSGLIPSVTPSGG